MTRDSQLFHMKKKRKVIAGISFFVIIFFVTLLKGGLFLPKEEGIQVLEEEPSLYQNAEAGDADGDGGAGQPAKVVPKAQIVVDIAGSVSRPGIVFLDEGSRIYEALELAGGALPDSDLRDVNLAAQLLDGEKIYIPSKKELEEQAKSQAAGGKGSNSGSGGGSAGVSKKININTADSAGLQRLPGVGPSLAERILEYRKENGRFKAITELKNVKGIGEKTYGKWKDMISVT